MAELKRRPVTIYLAIPPDRLRVCLGFVRGFIGLALDAITTVATRPEHRVAFFLDEFGQLGRMDRLADSIALLRGYGAQLWVFVQDLSQLKAVYPRWQSFLANTYSNSSEPPTTTPPAISPVPSASRQSASRPPALDPTPPGLLKPGSTVQQPRRTFPGPLPAYPGRNHAAGSGAADRPGLRRTAIPARSRQLSRHLAYAGRFDPCLSG